MRALRLFEAPPAPQLMPQGLAGDFASLRAALGALGMDLQRTRSAALGASYLVLRSSGHDQTFADLDELRAWLSSRSEVNG